MLLPMPSFITLVFQPSMRTNARRQSVARTSRVRNRVCYRAWSYCRSSIQRLSGSGWWMLTQVIERYAQLSFWFFARDHRMGDRFVYCVGCSSAFRQELGSLVTGTSKSHQRVQADAVFALPVVLFPNPISEAFERELSVVLQMTQASRRESRTLATLRDALLPKLVSGQVRVERV